MISIWDRFIVIFVSGSGECAFLVTVSCIHIIVTVTRIMCRFVQVEKEREKLINKYLYQVIARV